MALKKFEILEQYSLELWENIINVSSGNIALQRKMYPEEKPLMNSCFLVSKLGYERQYEIKEMDEPDDEDDVKSVRSAGNDPIKLEIFYNQKPP